MLSFRKIGRTVRVRSKSSFRCSPISAILPPTVKSSNRTARGEARDCEAKLWTPLCACDRCTYHISPAYVIDEPINHLDVCVKALLLTFLNRYRASLLLRSHWDRMELYRRPFHIQSGIFFCSLANAGLICSRCCSPRCICKPLGNASMTVAINLSPQGSSGIHLQNCDSFEPLRSLTILNSWFINKSAWGIGSGQPCRSLESGKLETALSAADSCCVDILNCRLSS